MLAHDLREIREIDDTRWNHVYRDEGLAKDTVIMEKEAKSKFVDPPEDRPYITRDAFKRFTDKGSEDWGKMTFSLHAGEH